MECWILCIFHKLSYMHGFQFFWHSSYFVIPCPMGFWIPLRRYIHMCFCAFCSLAHAFLREPLGEHFLIWLILGSGWSVLRTVGRRARLCLSRVCTPGVHARFHGWAWATLPDLGGTLPDGASTSNMWNTEGRPEPSVRLQGVKQRIWTSQGWCCLPCTPQWVRPGNMCVPTTRKQALDDKSQSQVEHKATRLLQSVPGWYLVCLPVTARWSTRTSLDICLGAERSMLARDRLPLLEAAALFRISTGSVFSVS